MSDPELLETAYTIMERIRLQHGLNLDSYIRARLHEWLRIYKNRIVQDAVDFHNARGALHIDNLNAVEEIRKLRD